MSDIKFRARIPERNATIYFDFAELLTNKFSNREILWGWLKDGNQPDRFTGLVDKNGKDVYENDSVMINMLAPENTQSRERVKVEFIYGYWNIADGSIYSKETAEVIEK